MTGSGEVEIRRVNDIARQLVHLPPEDAATQVVTHLQTFWDPRMRAALLAAGRDPALRRSLHPVALAAARLLMDEN